MPDRLAAAEQRQAEALAVFGPADEAAIWAIRARDAAKEQLERADRELEELRAER